MKKLKKGILISIEGIDGSGKSSLAKYIFVQLTKKKMPILLTKEPGETKLGEKLRKIIQKQDEPLSYKTEYLIFAADRAQHFQEFIIPNLKKNKIIISDRLGDSSIAYQGYGRGLNVNMIKRINKWTMEGIEPDLIFYIDIDIPTSLERIKKRKLELTSFEKEEISFLKKLIKGYKKLYSNKKNVIFLNGRKSIIELTNKASKAILSIIENHD